MKITVTCFTTLLFICRFMIGREKDPQNSEVARLIQQSIEQDKRRAEVRQRQVDDRQRDNVELERIQQEMMERRKEIEEEIAEEVFEQDRQSSVVSTVGILVPIQCVPIIIPPHKICMDNQ